MKRIWKFLLTPEGVIEMPINAEILSAGVQGEEIYIWAIVEPGSPTETRRFQTYGTGHQIDIDPDYLWFIGTVFLGSLVFPLVFHVFEDRWTEPVKESY